MAQRDARVERVMDGYYRAAYSDGDTREAVEAVAELLMSQNVPAELDRGVHAILEALRFVRDPRSVEGAAPARKDREHPVAALMRDVLDRYRSVYETITGRVKGPPQTKRPQEGAGVLAWLSAPAGSPPVAAPGPRETPPATPPATPRARRVPGARVRFEDTGAGVGSATPVVPAAPSVPSVAAVPSVPAFPAVPSVPAAPLTPATPPAPAPVPRRTFGTMTDPPVPRAIPVMSAMPPSPRFYPDSLAPFWMPYSPPVAPWGVRRPVPAPIPTLPRWYLERHGKRR